MQRDTANIQCRSEERRQGGSNERRAAEHGVNTKNTKITKDTKNGKRAEQDAQTVPMSGARLNTA